MARRCGAKRILQSKSTKHHICGAVFEVPMSINGTPRWREAHFTGKTHKTPHRGAICEVDLQKWHAAVARSTFASQNVKELRGWDHFLKL